MFQNNRVVFETKRIAVRLATVEDVEIFFKIWTNPQIMANVGYPNGLPITREEIKCQISEGGTSEFQQLLIVTIKSTDQVIGECKLHWPDRDGIATTDVKLLPEFWGNKFGLEVKCGLLDYLFTHTECMAVDASPNVGNIASIKMQEAVGGVCIGEGIYEFPKSKRKFTTPVHHFLYRVTRADWQKNHEQLE